MVNLVLLLIHVTIPIIMYYFSADIFLYKRFTFMYCRLNRRVFISFVFLEVI